MNLRELLMALPIILPAATAIVVMLATAVRRNHAQAAGVTLAGLAATIASVWAVWPGAPAHVTSLLVIDRYALFYTVLAAGAALVVAMLSHGYLSRRVCRREEYYVLLLLATTGAEVLVASSHFVSLILGLEILSVSLYAFVAYLRDDALNLEAGMKYLVLGGSSSAFLLFGIALVYAETGSLEPARVMNSVESVPGIVLMAGLAMILVGIGFKLALVPFHLWTPDVYQGAPAPVTAFVATVSKGAVFALMLRYFPAADLRPDGALGIAFATLAIASMFAGNLLALLQTNVKRMLAYSSIAHMGYLLVAFLAGGANASAAVSFYLLAYFITTLGAFGVVTVMSGAGRDADRLEDYRGLWQRRPWVAAVFTAMVFSLAGIPLTAGFIGKFYVLYAGVSSTLWMLVIVLAVNSAIGLFYYLRIIVEIFRESDIEAVREPLEAPGGAAFLGVAALAGLSAMLLGVGIYPGPLIELVRSLTGA